MEATVGDRLHVHGNAVGHPDKIGEIVEIRGTAGSPPYQVRFDDGHTCLVFPGPDAVVEPVPKARKAAPRNRKAAPQKRQKKAKA
ncbi:MAG: DUF1918 domain-containing protein [Streptomyces sp.]|jgi:hypothetical protein|nr:DUF1918 domain-containing protein [Streptomyces sp.]